MDLGIGIQWVFGSSVIVFLFTHGNEEGYGIYSMHETRWLLFLLLDLGLIMVLLYHPFPELTDLGSNLLFNSLEGML